MMELPPLNHTRGRPGPASRGLRAVQPSLALICLLVPAMASATARAASPALSDAPLAYIPDDAVGALLFGGPTHDVPAAERSRLGLVGFLADQATKTGLVGGNDPAVRAWVDAVAALPVVFGYPHAVVLLDVAARPRDDGGHELSRLTAALILDTEGDHARIEHRIQHLLTSYTNQRESTLTTTEVGGRKRFTLRDRRLPEWAVLSWGRMDGIYVITIGDGAYDRIVAAHSSSANLAASDWVSHATQRLADPPGPLGVYVSFAGLRFQGDPALARKARRVQDALGLSQVGRMLWMGRWQGRALEILGVLEHGGHSELAVLTEAEGAVVGPHGIVPEDATGYAAIQPDLATIIHAAGGAYLAARSPAAQKGICRFWRDWAEEADVAVDKDLLAPLGSPVVIHDYPRHPLRVPLALTIITPVQGNAGDLRRAVDRFLRVGEGMLPDDSLLRVIRDADDVWYVQYGLLGPAVRVLDDWVVLSYSPQAVRTNAAFLTTDTPREGNGLKVNAASGSP